MKRLLTVAARIGLPILLLILMVVSCKRDTFRVNVSGIETNIEIDRFEQSLFSADPADLETYIPEWEKKYGIFFRHFCHITGLGNTSDPGFTERLKLYVTDKHNYRVFSRTMEVFPDLNRLKEELDKAFKHYLHYFPDKPVPAIYTYISGLSQSAITDDSLMAIGLDRYLGTDERLYKEAGVYNYLKAKMHPAKIASDCMGFWGETEFSFNDSVDNLVANMIYRGRLLYFTKAMLPDQPDSLTLGFSGRELGYLNASEESIWAYLVDKKLLFNTDRFMINKFILEGPFTTDFGRNSPARAAVWTGYKITESYMKRNLKITLKELMEERNYMEILNKSGYNP